MEQIVGRIDDEYRHDADDEIVKLEDGTLVIDGSMSIDEVEELIGFAPPGMDDVETAAGLILMLLDRIPDEGDGVTIEDSEGIKREKATFTVVSMDRLRVDKIAVELS